MIREVLGSIEVVRIPKLGIEVRAKVDTGAWSGVLHCTDIHEVDGVLHFTPLGDKKLTAQTKNFETRVVRSASGHDEERYNIAVVLEINQKTYHTTLGLSDRSKMQREMLLGRKFLIENNILVDVSLTLDDDHEAERYL